MSPAREGVVRFLLNHPVHDRPQKRPLYSRVGPSDSQRPPQSWGPAGASAPLNRAHCKPQRGRAPQRRARSVRPLRATRRQHRCAGGIREGKSTQPCAKMATGCEVLYYWWLLLLLLLLQLQSLLNPSTSPAVRVDVADVTNRSPPTHIRVMSIHWPTTHLPQHQVG